MNGAPAFSRGGALALVAGGVALFSLLLWMIGAGEDIGGERGAGQAHAASSGLNGYAGLVRLVEAQGYRVERSRSPALLETDGLLVLTPSPDADAEEIGAILDRRRYAGPTLVIMPKWLALPSATLPPQARARFRRGWVVLGNAMPADWPGELALPWRFEHEYAGPSEDQPRSRGRWQGMGMAGALPTPATLHALPRAPHDALVTDGAGRTLAFAVASRRAGAADPDAYPVIILAEPDLANNYGLADPARAQLAIALVDELAMGGDIGSVTFDMTLNGLGASENLLTLAFRPPFLAATLCLLVALLIVGWRAFGRFGPPVAAGGPEIAFGKRQLILNGAGLILRARRFRLLARPYAMLSARRLAERLGLVRADPEAIDAALLRRLPTEEPFTRRAARLEAARKPAEILAAAQGLDDLASRLQQGSTNR